MKVLKIKDQQFSDVIDLFIFKKVEGTEYCMYIVSTGGVLVFKNIEKKEEQLPVIDEINYTIAPNCADCDLRGFLLVDAAQSN